MDTLKQYFHLSLIKNWRSDTIFLMKSILSFEHMSLICRTFLKFILSLQLHVSCHSLILKFFVPAFAMYILWFWPLELHHPHTNHFWFWCSFPKSRVIWRRSTGNYRTPPWLMNCLVRFLINLEYWSSPREYWIVYRRWGFLAVVWFSSRGWGAARL